MTGLEKLISLATQIEKTNLLLTQLSYVGGVLLAAACLLITGMLLGYGVYEVWVYRNRLTGSQVSLRLTGLILFITGFNTLLGGIASVVCFIVTALVKSGLPIEQQLPYHLLGVVGICWLLTWPQLIVGNWCYTKTDWTTHKENV